MFFGSWHRRSSWQLVRLSGLVPFGTGCIYLLKEVCPDGLWSVSRCMRCGCLAAFALPGRTASYNFGLPQVPGRKNAGWQSGMQVWRQVCRSSKRKMGERLEPNGTHLQVDSTPFRGLLGGGGLERLQFLPSGVKPGKLFFGGCKFSQQVVGLCRVGAMKIRRRK